MFQTAWAVGNPLDISKLYRGGELLRSDAEVRALTAAMPSVLGRRMGQMGGGWGARKIV